MLRSRPHRAGSRWRAAPLRPLARASLLGLALLALLSEGCASMGGGCGSGNGCKPTAFSGLRNRMSSCTQKLFGRRSAVVVDACDPALGAIPVEMGDPGMLPAGPVLTAPPIQADPDLQPLPPGEPGALNQPKGTQGARTGAVKSDYQTRAERPRGEAYQARREASALHDPLADLPEFKAPADSAAEASPPESPTETATLKPAERSAGLGPGVRRFKVIEPRMAVGSLPTENGWKWLAELGYKTVIDLREPSEVAQADLAAIDHLGFRRISVPIARDSIKAEATAKLAAELALENSRPVFVFDADGSRAAAAGYIHLVTARKLDPKTAEREVEELGAGDTAAWKAALTLLATPSPVKDEKLKATIAEPTADVGPSGASSVLSALKAIAPGDWTLGVMP